MPATTRIPATYEDISLMIPGGTGIYVPAEDSFLLLDLLAAFLMKDPVRPVYRAAPALDMGSGSGIIGLYLSKFFYEVHGVDVNYHAVRFQRTVRRETMRFRLFLPVNASLLSFLRPSAMQGSYFVACFNPPYLPATTRGEPSESGEGDLAAMALYAQDGGIQVLASFLADVAPCLMEGGHVFYVTSSLMGLPDHAVWLAGLGYRHVEEKREHFFFEDIVAHHAVKV